MRKDSIDKKAIEAAYLIFAEKGHPIVDYEFSHGPTDYARNTVEEPQNTSVVEGAFRELTPANVQNGFRYEDLKSRSEELDLKIDQQQDKLRVCRMRGNYQEFQRCMKEMQNYIKEKEALDARMATVTPGGNVGQKQMDDYNRTYDQRDSYSEMNAIGERIATLEQQMRDYLGE